MTRIIGKMNLDHFNILVVVIVVANHLGVIFNERLKAYSKSPHARARATHELSLLCTAPPHSIALVGASNVNQHLMLLPRLAALLIIASVSAFATTERQSLVNLYEATHVCVWDG